MQIISFLFTAWIAYVFLGGLCLFISWIFSNKYRAVTAIAIVGLFTAYIHSLPEPPPYKYSYDQIVYEPQPEPDPSTIYVTRIYGRPSIKERITLEECRLLPGYRGVVYGLCTSDESYAAYYE